jgi:hypothetical protein
MQECLPPLLALLEAIVALLMIGNIGKALACLLYLGGRQSVDFTDRFLQDD